MNTTQKFGIIGFVAVGIIVGVTALFGNLCVSNRFVGFKVSVVRGGMPAWKAILLEESQNINKSSLAIAQDLELINDADKLTQLTDRDRELLTQALCGNSALLDLSARRLEALAKADELE